MAASAVPRLIAVVVLPTPPFWLASARMRKGRSDRWPDGDVGGFVMYSTRERAVTRTIRASESVRLGTKS